MGRIIINIRHDIDPLEAIRKVEIVMKRGRVSEGAKNKLHYCWHSCFGDGECVSVKLKYGTDIDAFYVYRGHDAFK